MAEVGKKMHGKLVGEPVVVEATGTSANSKSGELSKRMEAAMVAAINKAMADGITDPDKVRALQLEARQKILDEQDKPREQPEEQD